VFVYYFWAETMDTFEKIFVVLFYSIHITSYTVTLLKDPGVATTRVVEFDEPIDINTAK
jgi:hypothetical protein